MIIVPWTHFICNQCIHKQHNSQGGGRYIENRNNKTIYVLGNLPKISPKLGDFVRTNSEAIIGVKLKKTPSEDFSKGVAISAGFHPDQSTHVETVRYGRGQEVHTGGALSLSSAQ